MLKKISILLVITSLSFLFYNFFIKKNGISAMNNYQIIPREIIFGNPDKFSVKISYDGKYLSYIAPSNGVLNIFVAPIDDLNQAKQYSNDTNRGIREYYWSHDNENILYLQDIDGDENWQIHQVNIKTKEDQNLTPKKGVKNHIVKISHKVPNKIIVSNNARNNNYFDLYEYDLDSKTFSLKFENNEYTNYMLDDLFNIRFLYKTRTDAGIDILKYDNGQTSEFYHIFPEDVTTTQLVSFDETGNLLYIIESKNTNTPELNEINLLNDTKKNIYSNPKAEISDILLKPITKTIQAVATNHFSQEWEVIDNEIKQDFDYLSTLSSGELHISSRTIDDNFWIIYYVRDDFPVNYYLYNRKTRFASILFSNNKKLEEYSLAKMHPVTIKSRDNLDLISYLTIPVEAQNSKFDYVPKSPLPLVLLVHGGPSARDSWGMNSIHQWLANRGYAVLSVNYRGSTGFGKNFFKAGFGEWAGKMHDDLIDAVEWSITNNIALKDKICIMGGSYGGYATLVGLTFTPEAFACGVNIVGPSNLITLLESIPPYWKPMQSYFINMMGGDPSTEEGKLILQNKSPINHISKINKPLLIAHGANDPRVKQSESDQIVEAMQKANIPVTYVLYPDEGHGFAKPHNRISFYGITESFLSNILGGKFEPIENDDNFEKSSLNIITGAENIKALDEKLKNSNN